MHVVILSLISSLFGASVAFLAGKIVLSGVEKEISKDWTPQLKPMIQEKLGGFIEKLKIKIPLAATFLGGALEETLKGQAEEEILNMLPEIQTVAAEQVAREKGALVKLALAGAVLGLAFGLAVSFF